ncbi:MAG: ROK family protein, partial [Deltaproteobacteria bacterium]
MVHNFLRRNVSRPAALAGIGIGLPLRLFRYQIELFHDFAEVLSRRLEHPVQIDNNVRSYTMYKKWVGQAFPFDNFVVISIRAGIGTGIYYQ